MPTRMLFPGPAHPSPAPLTLAGTAHSHPCFTELLPATQEPCPWGAGQGQVTLSDQVTWSVCPGLRGFPGYGTFSAKARVVLAQTRMMVYPRGRAVGLGLVYSSQSTDVPVLLQPQACGHLDHQYWCLDKMATMVLTTKMTPDTGGTELPPVEKHRPRTCQDFLSSPDSACIFPPAWDSIPTALPLAGSFLSFIICLNASSFRKPSLIASSSCGFLFPPLACFLCDFYHCMSLFCPLI